MGNPELIASLRAEPTEDESNLLDLYEKLKKYEKFAGKLRQEAIMAIQREKDEKFRQEQQRLADAKKPKQMTHRKKRKKSEDGSEMGNFSDGDANSDDSVSDKDEDMGANNYVSGYDDINVGSNVKHDGDNNDDDDDADEVNVGVSEEEEKKKKELEEAIGEKAQLSIAAMPSLRKKVVNLNADIGSIIESAPGGEKLPTPVHEFSESLHLLEQESNGKLLFPLHGEGNIKPEWWYPPPNATHMSEGCLEMELTDFRSTNLGASGGNNTIFVKFSVPQDSSRFSINIAGPGHREYYDVLFHFNPRQFHKGGQLIINDKQDGIWGMGVTAPLSAVPLIFGRNSSTLAVQITPEGFDVFLDGEHCARLEHRTQLPPNPCSLYLHFPSTDDYGSPENWKVYKVWWGHKAPMAGKDVTNITGVNSHMYGGLHPKKLFVSGLSKLADEPSVELRRAELERAFRKYGGAQGAIVIVPLNSTYAFVELESERMTDLALTEVKNYRMNRARRSKQDMLQEKKDAEEAAKVTATSESTEWD